MATLALRVNPFGSNDASFNTGNGFNDGIIVTRHLATPSVQAANIDYSTIGAASYKNMAPSFVANSASYANMTGATVTFTKGSAASSLLVIISCTNYASASGNVSAYGVNIGGTDYDVCRRYHDNSLTFPFTGSAIITGIAAGSVTVQARMKMSAGTATIDGNGFFELTVAEV